MPTEAAALRHGVAALALSCLAGPGAAADLTLQVTLPALNTASYYRPYLAAWVEKDADRASVGTLAVWYDTKLRDNLGRGWLRNLRTWWRGEGARLVLPIDGVSGATRPAGSHTLHFAAGHPLLAGLPAGRYQLAVEVAREQGDRELVRVPFDWGGAANAATADGSKELGRVSVSVAP